MKTKTLVTGALLAFVAVSVGVLIVKETGHQAAVAAAAAAAPKTPATDTAAPANGTAAAPSADADAPAPVPASGGAAPADTNADAAPAADTKVVVYYLHTSYRCASCTKLEAYTAEAVQQGFAGALTGGDLVFRSLNLDEPEHAGLQKRYELFTKSVVLSEVQGNEELRWKNLGRIWELLGDKEAYLKYVREEIEAFRSAS